MDFERELMEGRQSVLFWSDDRTAAAVTACALARRVAPHVFWLNIRSRGAGQDEFEPLISAGFPEELQAHPTMPFELNVPAPEPADDATRDGELSPLLVGAFEKLRTLGDRSALLLTNSERISGVFTDECTAFRPLLARGALSGVKLVVAHTGPAEWAAGCFGSVGHIETLPGREWSAALLTLERPAGAPPPERRRLRLALLESMKPFLVAPR